MRTSKKTWLFWILLVVSELIILNSCTPALSVLESIKENIPIHIKGNTQEEKLSTVLKAAFQSIEVKNPEQKSVIINKISKSIDFLSQIDDKRQYDLGNAISLIDQMELDISDKHMALIKIALASTYIDVGRDGKAYVDLLLRSLKHIREF